MSLHGWGSAAPIFRVRNLRASIDHYVNVLGFEVDWEADGIASVTRGRCCIFLCQGDQSCAPSWVWIGVDDAEALCDELRARGATIRHPPTNYSWAYEMQVADLDGNVLRLGSEPKPDEPTGDWLDGQGRLWRRSAGGEWSQVEGG